MDTAHTNKRHVLVDPACWSCITTYTLHMRILQQAYIFYTLHMRTLWSSYGHPLIPKRATKMPIVRSKIATDRHTHTNIHMQMRALG